MTLDLLYRTIYYHHTVRAATRMLLSLFQRAISLHRNGDPTVFGQSPLVFLIENGERISLADYSRLTEVDAWACMHAWQQHADPILKDLASRIVRRRLFKAIELKDMGFTELKAFEARAKEATRRRYAAFPPEVGDYFVAYDDPQRTSYKTYDWRPESADDSIWLVEDNGEEHPLEADDESTIVQALRNKRYFPRLIVPEDVRTDLNR
jgi:HD superfamily phosphohydrolase